MRQMHHWAADIFLGAIVIHMARIFFTGAFRKPRELNWTIGLTLLILALANGFIGYSLPDDLISGTGLRIMYSIVLSIPFVGTLPRRSSSSGATTRATEIIPRLFIIHVLILPADHRRAHRRAPRSSWCARSTPSSRAGGEPRTTWSARPMFPTFMAKTTGYLFMVTAVTAILGGFAQINPIWQFGQYQPDKISYAVQPDWYMGWLDGALRIMPAGSSPPGATPSPSWCSCRRWSSRASSSRCLCVAGHRAALHRGQRDPPPPRPPARPAEAHRGGRRHDRACMMTLLMASATDVLANFFQVSLNEVLWTFRILVIVVPIVVGVFTWRICIEMQGGAAASASASGPCS